LIAFKSAPVSAAESPRPEFRLQNKMTVILPRRSSCSGDLAKTRAFHRLSNIDAIFLPINGWENGLIPVALFEVQKSSPIELLVKTA